MYGRISLQTHPKVFLVGDVHGDLKALLWALRLTGTVRFSDQVTEKAGTCPQGEHNRSGYPLEEHEVRTIIWTGSDSAVVLLGDVLDNRRVTHPDRYGMCAMTGTQPLMIEVIQRLQTLANQAGGALVWVLGNHDVFNAIGKDLHSFCRRYAPQRTRYTRLGQDFDTCSPDGFHDTHRKYVCNALETCKATAMVRICVDDDDSGVIAVHGGLCDIDALKDSIDAVFGHTLVKGQPDLNVTLINKSYETLLQWPTDDALVRRYLSHCEAMPTWCRPESICHQEQMRSYFGTTRMVVAHTYVAAATCDDAFPDTDKAVLLDDTLCRIDVHMSRAFGVSNAGNPQVIRLQKEGKQIMRTIMRGSK